MTAKPNISHAIREHIRTNGPMTTASVAEALQMTDKADKAKLTKAASQMAKDGILIADKTKYPHVYSLGREAADMKTESPEVYQQRKRERHRLLMQRLNAEARKNRPPRPVVKKAVVKPVVRKVVAEPLVRKVEVVAETVEQWMKRTGQMPERLTSYLAREHERTDSA